MHAKSVWLSSTASIQTFTMFIPFTNSRVP
jgi:hypothetical protein